jgi:hypothetical protein
MNYSAWAESIRALLRELAEQDLGYPQDTHEIPPQRSSAMVVPDGLMAFYSEVDGASLPDVHVGYFLDSAKRVATATKRGEPTRIDGPNLRRIAVFGSDGGGGRFAIDTDDGSILYLPSGGLVRNGAFVEDDVVRIRKLAERLPEFLEKLQADVQAFVRGDEHEYLV